MTEKFRIGLMGTGAAAIEFIDALHEHPLAEITSVYGHSTAGKRMRAVIHKTRETRLGDVKIECLPAQASDLKQNVDIYCCALSDDDAAKERVKELEGWCASQKPTFSTASVWRYDADSLVLIPEVNPLRVRALFDQAKSRGWSGFIAPGPNCTTVGPAIALDAMGLMREDILAITFSSMQAVSGAGEKERQKLLRQRRVLAHQGFGAYALINGEKMYEGNVLCNIKGEEEKVRKELTKILGLSSVPINGLTHRVPSEYGHVVAMFVETKNPVDINRIKESISQYNARCIEHLGNLYSSPECFVRLTDRQFGPEPLFEADSYGGMCTHIGQLEHLAGRNGIRFDVLSHNLKKGAAKGSVQVMEYLIRQGFINKI
jgi:aspartate-semialdehyde dehydrogenase